MYVLHQTLLISHIIMGIIAMVAFWIPLIAAKGGLVHRQSGTIYAISMYIVSSFGIVMSIMSYADPIGTHIQYATLTTEQQTQAIQQTQALSMLLVTLSLLVFCNLHHGLQVLKAKDSRSKLKTPLHIGALLGLACFGANLFYQGLSREIVIYWVFGALSMYSAYGMLHYIFKSQLKTREWMIEHLAYICGSGIGLYTAFAAVGGRHWLAEFFPGQSQLVFWIGPGVFGGIAITIASYRFTKRFRVCATGNQPENTGKVTCD